MSETPAPRFDPKRRRAVTAALLLVTALASFESTVVSTAMPTIIGDLGGLPLYAWVFSVYLLTSTVAMPVYGRLADIHGRRRLMLVAIGVFLTGAVACALARSMPQLIAARALQGLGAAGLVPVALVVAADLYSLEERARVQGLFSGIWGFASLVGPLLGAFLTVNFGWRSIFSINIPLGLVALFLVATRMIESRAPLADPLDVAGSVTLAVGVTLMLFGVLHAPGSGGLSAGRPRRALLAAGVAALGGVRADPDAAPTPARASRALRGMAAGGPLPGRDPARNDHLRRRHFRSALRSGRTRRDGRGGRRRRNAAHLFLGALRRPRGQGHPAPRVSTDREDRGRSRALRADGPGGRRARQRARGLDQRGVRGRRRRPRVRITLSGARHPARRARAPARASRRASFPSFAPSADRSASAPWAASSRRASRCAWAAGWRRPAASSPDRTLRPPTESPPIAPALFRQAIERSLLPVFAVMLGLAAVNLWLTSGFPKDTSPVEEISPTLSA